MTQDDFLVNPRDAGCDAEGNLAISDPSAPCSPGSVTAHHLLSFSATTLCGPVLQTGSLIPF